LIEDGLLILQYADDLMLFLDHDIEQAMNMKLLLCTFEQLSGLKINFHNSKILCFGKSKECELQYSHLFGCKAGTYPFRYHILPKHYRKLNNNDWKGVEERIEKRLPSWEEKNVFYRG